MSTTIDEMNVDDQDILFNVTQEKVNDYVRKMVQGMHGEFTKETLIIMIPDIMMFVGAFKISKGATKKRIVLSAIDTAITSSNLSEEAKQSLLMTNKLMTPHFIDEIVWAAGQASNVFSQGNETTVGNDTTTQRQRKCCPFF